MGTKEDRGDVKRQPLPFSRESVIHVHEEGIQTRGKSRLRPEEEVELGGTLGVEEPAPEGISSASSTSSLPEWGESILGHAGVDKQCFRRYVLGAGKQSTGH